MKSLTNTVDYLFAEDRKGNKQFIKPTPGLQIRTTQVNGTRDVFYFDTVFIIDDTLQGAKSRILLNMRKKIPMDSLTGIELQRRGIAREKEF